MQCVYFAAQVCCMQQIKLLKRGAVSMVVGVGEGKRAETTVVQTNGLITAWVTHTCRCRLIPASICGKCHLAKGHTKQTLCAHTEPAAGKGSLLHHGLSEGHVKW